MPLSWSQTGVRPPQAALDRTVAFLKEQRSPTYMGAVSLLVGWSLARTQELLDVLQLDGSVHRLTDDELIAICLPVGSNVWIAT
jgi:hypothetical protein